MDKTRRKVDKLFSKPRFFAVLVLTSFFLLEFSQARVTVAFYVLRHWDGTPVVLEPGARFAHVELAFQGGWVHAHPIKGVVWEKKSSIETSQPGDLVFVERSDIADISPGQILPMIGRPYDTDFRWDTDNRIYCSELLGKVLNIPPVPMDFSLWSDPALQARKDLGLSPDGVYRFLTQEPSRNSHPISDVLRIWSQ